MNERNGGMGNSFSTVGPALRLHIPAAASGLGLLLQSGVGIDCLTGISIEHLLTEELQLETALRNKIDVYLLNGMPVDEPRTAIVDHGCRLALAAALPGIAGAAMRSNSSVAGLRPGITHCLGEKDNTAAPAPGRIELALFSMALPLLAPHMLARGVLISVEKLLPFLRETLMTAGVMDGQPMNLEACRNALAARPPKDMALLSACLPAANAG